MSGFISLAFFPEYGSDMYAADLIVSFFTVKSMERRKDILYDTPRMSVDWQHCGETHVLGMVACSVHYTTGTRLANLLPC